MKVRRSKTEHLCVNEGGGNGKISMEGTEINKVNEFKYLGSGVNSEEGCSTEVKKRIQAGWNGWRKVIGALCDRNMLLRVKRKVYRMYVRPAMEWRQCCLLQNIKKESLM